MRLETKTTCDYTWWLWWFWFDKMHESQFSYKNLGLLVFNSNITDTIKLHLLGQLYTSSKYIAAAWERSVTDDDSAHNRYVCTSWCSCNSQHLLARRPIICMYRASRVSSTLRTPVGCQWHRRPQFQQLISSTFRSGRRCVCSLTVRDLIGPNCVWRAAVR